MSSILSKGDYSGFLTRTDVLKKMKKIICILGIFIFTIPVVFPQVMTQQMRDRINRTLPKEKLDRAGYRCIYSFTQQVTDKKSGEEVALTDTMVLDIGPAYSVYYDRNKAFRDSLQRRKWQESTRNVKSITVNKREDMSSYKETPGNYTVSNYKGESSLLYKNRKKNRIIAIDGNDWEMYKCTEEVLPQTWEFLPDTLTVLGYACQKAVTTFRGRKYEVWFTPEIPINEGPWKLYGLPGLILKADADNGLFLFEAIGLENLEKKVPITMDKDTYLSSTREQFARRRVKKKQQLGVNHSSHGKVVVGQIPNPFLFRELETE